MLCYEAEMSPSAWDDVQTHSGFGLIELIITLAIIAFIIASISALHMELLNLATKNSEHTSFALIRRNIIISALDNSSWQVTYLNGSAGQFAAGNMGCIQNNTSVQCSNSTAPIMNQHFALFDGSGLLVWDGLNPTAGLTIWGDLCNTFDPNNATNGCFFHYDLTWSAVCSVPNCLNPLIAVQADLQIAKNSNMSFNSSGASVPVIYRSAH